MAQTNHWSASFYDFLLWSTFPERKIKNSFISDAEFSPYEDVLDSFEQVILKDLLRVLKPGSKLCIVDFGKSRTFYNKISFQIIRYLDGFENTSVNAKGLMLDLKILNKEKYLILSGVQCTSG